MLVTQVVEVLLEREEALVLTVQLGAVFFQLTAQHFSLVLVLFTRHFLLVVVAFEL